MRFGETVDPRASECSESFIFQFVTQQSFTIVIRCIIFKHRAVPSVPFHVPCGLRKVCPFCLKDYCKGVSKIFSATLCTQ